MAAEFVRYIFRHFERNHTEPTLYKDRNPFQTRSLAPHIEELLTLASASSSDDARSLYHEAGNEAVAIYSAIQTTGITSEERIIRGKHAEIAVTSFINAGELADAKSFGEEFLLDPHIPEVSRSKIQKALEIFA